MEASIRTTLGKTYRSLSLFAASEKQLRRAVELERGLVGERHPDFAEASSWLALTLYMEGKPEEAESMERRAIEVLRSSMPERAPRLVGAVNDLGLMLWTRGDAAQAEPLFQEALELSRRYQGEAFPIVAAALGNLGLIHDLRGDLGGAEDYYRKSLSAFDRIPEPPLLERAIAQGNIATVLRIRGQYAESERLGLEALTTFRKLLGLDDVTFVMPMLSNLADLHRLSGDLPRAEREIVQVLTAYDARLPRDHLAYAWAELVHGLILTDTGRAAAGETCLRRALDISRRSFKAGDRRIASTEGALGHCLATQRRYAEAEPLLIEGFEGLKRAAGEAYPRTRQVERWLVDLYENWGRPARAASYRAALARTAP
jgi:tetratricopeptide (TPR) repeat protein